MNWLKKLLLIISLTFFACNNTHYTIAPHDNNEEGVANNQYIPSFELPDSTGNILVIHKLMGKATLIDFWASWCRPCRESADPAYKKLYAKYHTKGFDIVGVSSDRHTYFWKKALLQDSLPWHQVIDSTHKVLELYHIKSIPAMFLIDRNGKIAGKNLWEAELEHKIDSLLQ